MPNYFQYSSTMRTLRYLMVFILFVSYSCNFGPGSYPFAEIYELDGSEPEIIDLVKQFKLQNPEYNVPEYVGLKDGKSNGENDYWYHVYFYYQDTNQIVYAWIREVEPGKTSFAFVGINEGLQLGNWRHINDDFDRDENREQKEKFEKLILSPIKNEPDSADL